MLAHSTGRKAVDAAINQAPAHINLGTLSGVDSSHDNLCIELITADDGARLRNDKSLELVDPDVLKTNIGNQGMENFALGVAHIVLKLGKQSDGSRHGHILEHVLLPVLTQRAGLVRYGCSEVRGYDAPLVGVADEGEDALPIRIDGTKEGTALTRERSEHH